MIEGRARTNHLHEIDVLYAIGTLLAILGHSHPSDWDTFPGEWVVFIYYFHMPLFFLIAGFLFAASERIEQLNFGRWLWEKALRLLTPYFVLSAIALVPKYALEHHGISDITPGYILTAFFVPRQNVWGHFWFLPVLFFLYFLFGLLRKSGVMNRSGWMTVLFILTVGLHFWKSEIQWLGGKDICDYAVYFLAGYVMYGLYTKRKAELSSRAHFIIFISTLAASIAMYSVAAGSWYRNLLISAAMLACCWALGQILKNSRTPALDFISRYVFTFYIYSWFAQAIVECLCSHLGLSWTVVTPAMFAAGLIVPAMIVWLYSKLDIRCRFLDLLLGIRK